MTVTRKLKRDLLEKLIAAQSPINQNHFMEPKGLLPNLQEP
jgi:hypothetical protein